VTVTITLDYRTTRGDAARAWLTLDDGTHHALDSGHAG
jgi:hypothetical protein